MLFVYHNEVRNVTVIS